MNPPHFFCFFHVFRRTGIYGVNTEDLKHGKNKKRGYITGADSPQLTRLLGILEFFDCWQTTLQAAFEPVEWQKHFVTAQSWFDMRATILGFVSMSRYIFSDENLVKERSGKARRFLYPRMFSQVAYTLPSKKLHGLTGQCLWLTI